MLNKNFWRNRRILITGHTGFKGAWLTVLLHQLNADVIGYALPATSDSLFSQLCLDQYIVSIQGDIRDVPCLMACMEKYTPEIVLHLAAQPLVFCGYEDPFFTYSVNVMGTVSLLEAVRKNSALRVLLNVTTDKCYQNKGWIWPYRETDRLGGRDPYSSSKACSELITDAYRHAFLHQLDRMVGVATGRSGNVIGGGDWSSHRLIPDAMRHVIDGSPLVMRNPEAVRPWLHVLDTLLGYLLLCEKLWESPKLFSGAWNFSANCDSVVSVETLIQSFFSYLGASLSYSVERSEYKEAQMLLLDSTKSRQILGWKPLWSVEKSIEVTAHWYRAFMNSKDLFATTMEQIDFHLNALYCTEI